MKLTREEIIDLALRYINKNELVDFPFTGDLFNFFMRTLNSDPDPEQATPWHFTGYGLCLGYEKDLHTKPEGKWLSFSFLSLDTYPPPEQTLKLQPPHIARGLFQNQGRTHEIKIQKINILKDLKAHQTPEKKPPLVQSHKQSEQDNIIPFPSPKK